MLGQHAADRLDPEPVPILLDEGHYHGGWRVELPREETRGRQQDLVGPLQLPDLTLQILDPPCVTGGGPRPLPAIDAVLLDPAAQRVRDHPDPFGDPDHRLVHRQRRILGHRF
jgi:hypothetical protein